MFKKSVLAISAVSTIALPAAAEARHYRGYEYNNGYSQAYYQPQGYYAHQGYGYDYGNDYRDYRRHRCSGTTGTIIGAGAGALLGRSIGRGNGYHRHTDATGTIVGAALGALVGHEIGRSTC